MRIILLRHGKPDIPVARPIKVSDFPLWIDAYNAARISVLHPPSNELKTLAASCRAVVASDLPRALSSAELLGVANVNYAEPLFREMGMPYANFPAPKLSPNLWALWFRCWWFMGCSPNSESFVAAKSRAVDAALRLMELAKHHESVLFVGHGLLNRYVAQCLRANAWRGPENPGKHYWSFGVYECALAAL